jgi:hypothetical protein
VYGSRHFNNLGVNKETLLRYADMRYRDIKCTGVQDIDGTVHAVLTGFVLVVSALAGRQFFMDGTNFIVQSFLDPLWYPRDQVTLGDFLRWPGQQRQFA